MECIHYRLYTPNFTNLRVYLLIKGVFAQLQIKNSSTPNFLSQTHPTPAAPPWICSRKKVKHTPSMGFIEYLKRYSTKSKFPGVVRNYPPLSMIFLLRVIPSPPRDFHAGVPSARCLCWPPPFVAPAAGLPSTAALPSTGSTSLPLQFLSASATRPCVRGCDDEALCARL
jgi:hypothetical protein